jgi:hypothetical protein
MIKLYDIDNRYTIIFCQINNNLFNASNMVIIQMQSFNAKIEEKIPFFSFHTPMSHFNLIKIHIWQKYFLHVSNYIHQYNYNCQ